MYCRNGIGVTKDKLCTAHIALHYITKVNECVFRTLFASIVNRQMCFTLWHATKTMTTQNLLCNAFYYVPVSFWLIFCSIFCLGGSIFKGYSYWKGNLRGCNDYFRSKNINHITTRSKAHTTHVDNTKKNTQGRETKTYRKLFKSQFQ